MCIIPKQYWIKVNLRMLIKVFCPASLTFLFLVFFSAVPPSKHHEQKHCSGLCGVCCTSEDLRFATENGRHVPSCRHLQHLSAWELLLPWGWATLEHPGWVVLHVVCLHTLQHWLVGCILHLSKILVQLILLQYASLSGLIMSFWEMKVSTEC